MINETDKTALESQIRTDDSPSIEKRVQTAQERESPEGRHTVHAEISQGIQLFNSQKLSMRSSKELTPGGKDGLAALSKIREEHKEEKGAGSEVKSSNANSEVKQEDPSTQ